MGANHVVFVGGPRSGKSNYLFRIWIALERESGRLIKRGLPDDLSYLLEGSALLLDATFAPHTSRDSQHTSIVPVQWRDGPSLVGDLVMPDASGELWLELYRKREWSKSWDDLITPNSGIVLMICAGSPDNVPSLDWITCERLYGFEHKSAPTNTPTQVMLVDWLQILHSIADRKAGMTSAPRLSVVVSAWDRLSADQLQAGPLEYIEANFPMLAQFIESNAHGFQAKLFGLSIFGGDPDTSAEYRKHVQLGDVASLGYIAKSRSGSVIRSTDVLEPIYWALGDDL